MSGKKTDNSLRLIESANDLQKDRELVADLPSQPGLDESKQSRRKIKKRKELFAEATRLYGTDFVPKLESNRDPKERIIFVAEAVFARKGFAGARTQEIADLASVNKAMIHYYFESKEKLYHALLDKILFDLIKLMQESVSDDLPYPEQLDVFYRGFFDYVASHKNFSRITTMEIGSNDRYLARLVETFFKPLFDRGVTFIKEGIARGDFKKVNERQFLVSIYAMTMAYFSDAEFIGMLLGVDPLSKKLVKERRDLLLDMVFASLECKRPR
ncbi:MAG: TetR/AcrR family transcriptional regulator [Deltaproteobacteria bacterium]|nr:TetR/AcrR family transcriptional regulator [Deltaproteobacteria bacterium]MBW1870827.1 TetR/AcrR family transcriptional regulator [Deltaproteobacteria bacterium]